MQNEGSFLDVAGRARVLAAITFHFNPERLRYLFQTVKSLASFPVAALEVAILTNTSDPDEIDAIRSLCLPVLDGGRLDGRMTKCGVIYSCTNLPSPLHLAWCHKSIMRERFLAVPPVFDYFIYLEDDMELSFLNFCYFVHYRPLLEPHGLLPSFVRMEYQAGANRLVSTDQYRTDVLDGKSTVEIAGKVFLGMDNPHIAMFIMDRALAADHLASAASDCDRSLRVRDIAIRERAAMGACFDAVPEGFSSRLVVPFDAETLTPLSASWIYHLPANYASNPTTPFGKLRPEQLLVRSAAELPPSDGSMIIVA